MSNDNGGFDLESAVESGADAIRKTREFLGVEREAHVCPDCGVACEEGYVYDPQRAAFDDGKSPAWKCPECDSQYVRETHDESHTMDLYGRE